MTHFQSKGLTKIQAFKLTKDTSDTKMGDFVGRTLPVIAYTCIDTLMLGGDLEGQTVPVIHLELPDNVVTGTNSQTFIEQFRDIHNLMLEIEEEEQAEKQMVIEIISGISKKKGREFVSCRLVDIIDK